MCSLYYENSEVSNVHSCGPIYKRNRQVTAALFRQYRISQKVDREKMVNFVLMHNL